MAQTNNIHHRHLARGTTIGLVSTVMMGVVNYFLRRHWALTLGPADFGWFYINYTVFYFAAILIDLGGANYSMIAIAKHHEAGEADKVNHVFFATALYKLLSGLVGAILFWFLAPWLAVHFFHYPAAVGSIRLMTLFFPLFCLEGHLFTVLCSFKAFITGYGLLVLKFVLILLFALMGGASIRLPPLLFIGGSGLFCLCAIGYLFGSGKVKLRLRFLSLRGVGQYLVKGIWLALYNIGAQTVLYADQLVATLLLGAAAMAVYQVAVPLVQIVYSLLMIVPTVGIPVMATLWEQEDAEPAVAGLCSAFLAAMLALLWLALLVTLPLGNLLVTLLFSGTFVAAGPLLPFLSAGIILYIAGFFCFNAWNARRRNHATSLIMIMAPLLNVGLCLLLVPRHGLRGAAMAVGCTHAAICVAACVLLKVKLPSFRLAPLRALYISTCGAVVLAVVVRGGPIEALLSRRAAVVLGGSVVYLLLVAPAILPRLRAAGAGRGGRRRPASSPAG
ncbi:MAG: oligosaccharide flippase family protein [Verrucomicrobia bacterium]|jgi:O-antigen/teichoic acid export membrane protein|nr:oligosaccharide flippase family protein [Verrucomicrobiota bacterium]